MSTPSPDDVRALLDREADLAREHMPPFESILASGARRRRKRRTAAIGGGIAAGGLIVGLAFSLPIGSPAANSPIAAASDSTPRWVTGTRCTPSSSETTTAVEGLTTQDTNFDTIDSFAQRLTSAEEARPHSTFGGLHWDNPTDGLIVQLGGSGDAEAKRLLAYADREGFPYPLSFERGLTTSERRSIGDDLLAQGIDGHTVKNVSITSMCNDVEVALSEPVSPAEARQLSQSASKEHGADIEVGAVIMVRGAR